MQNEDVEQGQSFSVYAEIDLAKPRRSRGDIQMFLIHCANKREVWSHPGVQRLIRRDLQRKILEKTQPMQISRVTERQWIP